MYIARIQIRNYRCFSDTVIEFQPGLNVIIGENNAGKTTLLKALSLIFDRRSHGRPTVHDFHRLLEPLDRAPRITVSVTLRSSNTDSAADRALVASWLTQLEPHWEAQLTYSFFLPETDEAGLVAALNGTSDREVFFDVLEEFLPKYVTRIYGGNPDTVVTADGESLAKFDCQFLDALRDVESEMFSGRNPLLRAMLQEVLDLDKGDDEKRELKTTFRQRSNELRTELVQRLDTTRLALAKRVDMSYEQLLIERLTAPLAMHSTRITLDDDQKGRFAPPFFSDLSAGSNWQFDSLKGCGAVRSTATDLLKLAAAAISGGDRSIDRSLRKAFRQQLSTNMGLGWRIDPDGTTRYHQGQTGGYAAALFVNVPQQIAVVILTNTGCYPMPHIGRRILQECMGDHVEPFRFPKQIAVYRSVLEEYVGIYQFNADEQIIVSLGPSHLAVRFTGEPKYPLFAKSTNEFFCTVDEIEIVFIRSDSGTSTSLTVDHFGEKTKAPRVTTK